MSVEVKGMKTSTERTGSSFSGYPMLALILALLLLVAWNLSGNLPPDGAAKGEKLAFVGLLVAPILVLAATILYNSNTVSPRSSGVHVASSAGSSER